MLELFSQLWTGISENIGVVCSWQQSLLGNKHAHLHRDIQAKPLFPSSRPSFCCYLRTALWHSLIPFLSGLLLQLALLENETERYKWQCPPICADLVSPLDWVSVIATVLIWCRKHTCILPLGICIPIFCLFSCLSLYLLSCVLLFLFSYTWTWSSIWLGIFSRLTIFSYLVK